MAIEYDYRYTVETYIDYGSALTASQPPRATNQSFQLSGVFPTLVGDYIENNNIHRPYSGVDSTSVSNTPHTRTVEPNFIIEYRVKFYMVVKDETKQPYNPSTTFIPSKGMPQNPTIYWLGSAENGHNKTNITNLIINEGDMSDKPIGNLNIVDHFDPQVATASALWPEGKVNGTDTTTYYSFGTATQNDTKIKTYNANFTNASYTYMSPINDNGDTFKVYVATKTPGATLNPGITFNAKIINNYSESNKTGWLDPSTATNVPRLWGTHPYFIISNKRAIPPIPNSLIDKLNEKDKLGITPFYAKPYYDFCGLATGLKKPSWIGITAAYTKLGVDHGPNYNLKIYMYNLDGTVGAPVIAISEQLDSKNTKNPYGPQLRGWISKINLAILANCNDTNSSGDNGNGVSDNTYVPTVQPTDDERYNPPPHIGARDVSFGQRMLTLSQQTHGLIKQDPVNLNVPDMRVGFNNENLKTKGLGRIIQDSNSAAQLNTNIDKLSIGTGLWGFRFMYNPTDITYNTSSNNQIDYTLGEKDPASLLAGNQNVSFQLYFNRIPDMQYLRDYKNNSNHIPPLRSVYGTDIKDTAIDGLLNRGTEYDIEFLYRVLNGDPLDKPLLFGDNYKGYTSDFGYTTATPCWLYLNDNLRYFGSVASINVYHRIFTMDMIPMFSVVNISFARYPSLWNKGAANFSFQDLYGKNNSTLSNSLKPDNITGTGKKAGAGET